MEKKTRNQKNGKLGLKLYGIRVSCFFNFKVIVRSSAISGIRGQINGEPNLVFDFVKFFYSQSKIFLVGNNANALVVVPASDGVKIIDI